MVKLFSTIPLLRGERVTLRRLSVSDAEALQAMTESENVYRYLPTFLYEKKYDDKRYVIEHLYDECLESSLILGIYLEDEFCGLFEIYGYNAILKKVSVGYRLSEKYWGVGIASEALVLMVGYLLENTETEIITASTMIENKRSAAVLKKNGFKCVMHGVWEDWGFSKPTVTDKWIRTKVGYQLQEKAKYLPGSPDNLSEKARRAGCAEK